MLARIPPHRLIDLLDMTEDGIVTVDAGQTIVLYTRGAERLFGYAPDEVLGRPLDLLIPARHRAAHRRDVDGFAAGGAAARIMGHRREVTGLRKDGTEFPAEVSISRFRDPAGPLFTAIVRDVTERRRAEAAERDLARRKEVEEALRETNRQREEALRALEARTEELRATTQQLWQAARLAGVGELAASIAHELNNPLGTVSLRVEGVLAKTPPGDPRRRALEVVEQEVERMAALVSNLLQFSRPGRDQISTVDLCDEVAQTLDLVAHHLRRRGVEVAPEYAPAVPPIYADRQQLRQVFLNLFTNASDAMPRGGRLSPRVRPGDLPGGEPAVVVEVADTGTGIPEEHLPRVTDPFFTTKPEGEGTGLGLAICKRIVQQHRGTLEIESRPGAGTTVRLTLPVRTGNNVTGLHGP